MKATNIRQGTVEPVAAPVAPKPTGGPEVITDSDGRRLTLRDLTLLEEQDLLVAVGAHGDSNRALQRALLAARVGLIDGDPIPVPRTNIAYRALMQRVGAPGLIAVVAHLAPAPVGDPIGIFEGELGDYRLMPHGDGGVGLFRVEAVDEVQQAKN